MLTPTLMLDESIMRANIARMQNHLEGSGVALRPHVKTAKSLPVIAEMVADQASPKLTVSTLREASRVLAAGYTDVLYAIGIVPNKLAELVRLARAASARVSVILDSQAMARALVEAAARSPEAFPLDAFIELDVDDHRAGVAPDSAELIAIGQLLGGGQSSLLRGVMTHAGGSYDCASRQELIAMAERERSGAVQAAQALRSAGIACSEVSIGSTPTVIAGANFDGVTEVRVGVYVFNDLVMAGLGVCETSDIALSVLSSVIGHQPGRNTLLIDAGWMALSSDRSKTHQKDYGLGLVVPAGDSKPPASDAGDLIVVSANQEHGLVQHRTGQPIDFSRFPIGSLVRVMPIHACATAAQYEGYQLTGHEGHDGHEVEEAGYWPRFGGWSADK